MKVRWQSEIPQLAVIVGMFVLALLSWSSAPEQIPVHWNAAGEVDRYGGKFEGLLVLPIITLGTYGLLLLLPRVDPGRANYKRFETAYTVIRVSVIVVLACAYALIHLWIRGHQIDVTSIIKILMGGMLVVLGNFMGKIRPNWFVGIRTPWTLASKEAWTKTHRRGGWVFIASGLVMIVVGTLAPEAFMWALAPLMLGIAVLVVYSYLVWKSDPNKVAPAGTLPAEDENR